MALTVVDGAMLNTANAQYTMFKNRIINGGMAIDQRNAGASVTPTNGQYTLDRWIARVTQASKFTVQQNAGAVTPPTGYSNYLGCTSSSAYTVLTGDFFSIEQYIEGLNSYDLAWGTASAATVTLSFWVRSSLTGTFGGTIRSYQNATTASYPFTYTISAANTWEQKTITIAGPTTGTWVTTNAGNVVVCFSLGAGATYSGTAGAWASTSNGLFTATGATSVVGVSGATFYVTGVQLEKGSNATSFDYRPYGAELSLCYRYYRRYSASNAAYTGLGSGVTISASSLGRWGFPLDTPMRTIPVPNFNSCVGYNGTVGGAVTVGTNYSSINYVDADLTTSGMGATLGLSAKILMNTAAGYVELNGCEL